MITYPYLVVAKARIEGLREKILSGPVLCVVDFGHGIVGVTQEVEHGLEGAAGCGAGGRGHGLVL